MGNCLKRSTADDISLLRGNESARESSDFLPEIMQPVFYPSSSGIGGGSGGGGGGGGNIIGNVSGLNSYGFGGGVGGNSTGSSHLHRSVHHLTEEEQIRIAKRIGLIQHLPIGLYDGCRKSRECVICMIEFTVGDSIRYLPCMHTYHVNCIDDWLMRSLTCPSCMEPVDAALLTTYETT